MHIVNATPIASTATASIGLFGFSMTSIGVISLPFDLTALGFTGCKLHVSLDYSQPAVTGAAAATWQLPIPNIASLLGLAFYQQMAVAEPAANPAGIIFSDALANVIGS